jgi:hypothetical protein
VTHALILPVTPVTRAAAMNYCKALGFQLTYDRDVEEYCLSGRGAHGRMAYYTPWADDAVGTAKAEQARKWQVAMRREGKKSQWRDASDSTLAIEAWQEV